MNNSIYTWQSVLTDHQAFTYEALSHQADVEIISYVVVMEDEIRKTQGWQDLQVLSIKRLLIPRYCFFKYCFSALKSGRGSIHIFAAPFSDIRFIPCMLFAAWLGVEFYIISEPYSPLSDGYLRESSPLVGRLKALFRPWLYRLYGLMIRSSVAGIFTISERSYKQFQVAGLPLSKLFRFGYFVPRQLKLSAAKKHSQEYCFEPTVRVIFVGSLIKIKGVDLLGAVAELLWLRGSKIVIDVYGPGSIDSLVLQTVNIKYRGVIPFGQAQDVMTSYDLVLVPSRYDGWGVVVNEAILVGVPVICSNEVGAGALIDKFSCGLRFQSGDIVELADILIRLEKDFEMLQALRSKTVAAMKFIEPEIAANYMLQVIDAPYLEKAKISSPWYSNEC